MTEENKLDLHEAQAEENLTLMMAKEVISFFPEITRITLLAAKKEVSTMKEKNPELYKAIVNQIINQRKSKLQFIRQLEKRDGGKKNEEYEEEVDMWIARVRKEIMEIEWEQPIESARKVIEKECEANAGFNKLMKGKAKAAMTGCLIATREVADLIKTWVPDIGKKTKVADLVDE